MRAVVARGGVKSLDARITEVIVDDAGLLRTYRRATEPTPLRARLAGRYPCLARAGGGRTGGSHDVEIFAVGLYQRDGGQGGLASGSRCFTHQFEQFRPRGGADDRFVG